MNEQLIVSGTISDKTYQSLRKVLTPPIYKIILLCLLGGFPCYLAGRKEIAAVRREIAENGQKENREEVSAGRENETPAR